MKNLLKTLVNILSGVMIAAALFVLLSVFITRDQVPSIFGYSAFRVLTGSMEPVICRNDMIIVKKTSPQELKVGDVITFYSRDPELSGAPVTHRLTDAQQGEDGWVFTTKGDANLIPDQYPVSEEAVIGKVVFVSALVGKVAGLTSNPLVFALFIFVPLLVILVSNLVKAVVLAKETAMEEEAQETEAILEAARQPKHLDEEHKQR